MRSSSDTVGDSLRGGLPAGSRGSAGLGGFPFRFTAMGCQRQRRNPNAAYMRPYEVSAALALVQATLAVCYAHCSTTAIAGNDGLKRPYRPSVLRAARTGVAQASTSSLSTPALIESPSERFGPTRKVNHSPTAGTEFSRTETTGRSRTPGHVETLISRSCAYEEFRANVVIDAFPSRTICQRVRGSRKRLIG